MPGVPRDTTRRIGLLGGSFNPAHEGHRHVSLEALKRLGLDEVWWLVSPQNPLKARRRHGAAGHARARAPGSSPAIRASGSTRPSCCSARATRSTRCAALQPALSDGALRVADGRRHPAPARRLAGLARAVRRHPDRRLRPAGLELCRRCVSAAPRAFARYRIDAGQARALASCEPPAWCFIPSRLDSHSATAIRAVRPRRTKAKGKTISDQSSSERGRQLPDRSKDADALLALVRRSLDDDKAEDVVVIDLKGKSAFADYMVIASGRSNRQVVAIADHLADTAEAGRPRLHPGRRQAGRRLGAGRCRRRGRPHLPPRAARLLRAGEDVGARDRGAPPAAAGRDAPVPRRVKKPA